MPKPLVIVESPAKAKTIQGYLGPRYEVEASVGHIRDLPSAPRHPRKYKGEPWSRLGVDVDHGYQPLYVVDARTRRSRPELKTLLKDADELSSRRTRTARARPSPGTCSRCSTRRSRSSGWSSTRSPATRSSAAVDETRDLDQRLVDAQETRRILDRLYGYEVSPVLWKKVMPGCRPAACSRWRRAWSSTASAGIAFRGRVVLGHRGALRTPGEPARSARSSARSTAARVATGRDFGDRRRARPAPTPRTSTRPRPALAAGLDGGRLHRPLGRGQALQPLARRRRS